MVSRLFFMLMLALALVFAVYAQEGPDAVVKACADDYAEGICNVFKPYCGSAEYLENTQSCRKTCGMC